jgi:hypothetical protein
LFKNSHNTKFRVVAVSVMPKSVVVVFSAQWAFSILELNISALPSASMLSKSVGGQEVFGFEGTVKLSLCTDGGI